MSTANGCGKRFTQIALRIVDGALDRLPLDFSRPSHGYLFAA
jgi:hypothetical protein